MADDDAEKIFSSSSSRPFTVRSGCKFIELSHQHILLSFRFSVPFVFLPSAFAEGFTFVNHPGDDGAPPADEQATSDSTEKKTIDEDEDEDENDDDDEDERGM